VAPPPPTVKAGTTTAAFELPAYRRGPSARSYLSMDWKYPVYTQEDEAPAAGNTVAKKKRQAMTREEAVAFISGDDPRPLLVLRECKVCNGTDDALLKGGVDNEKTFLIAQWFHCVKLPVDVMEDEHPLNALFTMDQPEHLFVCSPDGSNHDALESQTSRTELWKSLRGMISREYARKPDSSLKKLASLLDKMDVVDERLGQLSARQDDILEEDGPGSKKLKKVRQQVAKSQADRDGLHADFVEASALELKRRKAQKSDSEGHAKSGS
jgi:hypothetical protein